MPEYYNTVVLPRDRDPPAHAKQLPPHFNGEVGREEDDENRQGEQPGDAAFRELKEETGITKASLLAETEDWLTYDLPPEALGIALKGKYRGQRQKWLAMRFEGDDNEIDIASGKDGKPEFDAWKWAAISELPELIIPFKRKVYLQVADAFRHLAG